MWQNGRQLASYNKGDISVSYTYDSDGLRTSKTVNGVKHEYLYDGDKVVYEKRGEDQFFYYYDSYGHFSAIRHICAADNTDYIYYANTNAQGDVIGLYNGPGTQIVSYEYDAWGNVISMVDLTNFGLGTLNPIRYRGYYYDEETGWYYLQSRYYDPEIGRFISTDGQLNCNSLSGLNVFAYCNNNPINLIDTQGTCPQGVMGPCPGPGRCEYLTNLSAPFENTTTISRDTLMQAIEAISNVSPILDIGLRTAETAFSIPQKRVPAALDTNNYIRFAPKGLGFSVPRFPGTTQALKTTGYVLSGASLAIDLALTFTEDSGNTVGKRIGKAAIQCGGFAAGIGVGVLAVAAANCWNPVGWGAAAAFITYTVINIAGTIIIAYAQESMYDIHGIN